MTELNERVEAARRLFQEGFNCAQAVVGAFYPPEKREGQLALKLASGFGGGMRRGEVCGAVSGAVMVLGMREGYLAGDQAAKLKSSELTSALWKGMPSGRAPCIAARSWAMILGMQRPQRGLRPKKGKCAKAPLRLRSCSWASWELARHTWTRGPVAPA